MRHRTRLDRLERHRVASEPKRCDTCRDWPRIVTRSATPTPGGEWWETKGVPEQCPSCGWCPFAVVVEMPEMAA